VSVPLFICASMWWLGGGRRVGCLPRGAQTPSPGVTNPIPGGHKPHPWGCVPRSIPPGASLAGLGGFAERSQVVEEVYGLWQNCDLIYQQNCWFSPILSLFYFIVVTQQGSAVSLPKGFRRLRGTKPFKTEDQPEKRRYWRPKVKLDPYNLFAFRFHPSKPTCCSGRVATVGT